MKLFCSIVIILILENLIKLNIMIRNSQFNRATKFNLLNYKGLFIQQIYMTYTLNIFFLIRTIHPLIIHMLLYSDLLSNPKVALSAEPTSKFMSL